MHRKLETSIYKKIFALLTKLIEIVNVNKGEFVHRCWTVKRFAEQREDAAKPLELHDYCVREQVNCDSFRFRDSPEISYSIYAKLGAPPGIYVLSTFYWIHEASDYVGRLVTRMRSNNLYIHYWNLREFTVYIPNFGLFAVFGVRIYAHKIQQHFLCAERECNNRRKDVWIRLIKIDGYTKHFISRWNSTNVFLGCVSGKTNSVAFASIPTI